MTIQLAEESVRTYRLAPEGFTASRKKLLRQKIVFFACMIFFTLFLSYKMFGETWRRDSLASFLPTFASLVLMSGALGVGIRKGIKRYKDHWDSFELVVGEDFLIRRIKDFPDLEIQRHEVTGIKETETGFFVRTKLRDRTIGVNRALVDYEDAKERLSRWIPLVHEPSRWNAPSRWMWIIPIITIILFALCATNTNDRVVVATGLPLIIGLVASIWFVRKSLQTSTRTKRLSLLSLLPLLAITVRVIQAVQRLK